MASIGFDAAPRSAGRIALSPLPRGEAPRRVPADSFVRGSRRRTATPPQADPTIAIRAAVKNVPGFAAMGADEQRQFDLALAGKSNKLSSRFRKFTVTLLRDGRFQGLSAASQAKVLNLLTSKLSLPTKAKSSVDSAAFTVTTAGQRETDQALKQTGKPIKEFEFRGSKEAAIEYRGPGGVPVIVPKNGPASSDEHLPSLEQVFQAITVLEPKLRKYIDRVVVNPVANPDDAYWTKKNSSYLKSSYDRLLEEVDTMSFPKSEEGDVTGILADLQGIKPAPPQKPGAFRSVATGNATTGQITYYPRPKSDTEYFELGMRATMIHEVGHLWSKEVDSDDWGKRIEAEGLRPSRYGATSTAEDQAELMVLHVGSRDAEIRSEFHAMFPRMKLIESTLQRTTRT